MGLDSVEFLFAIEDAFGISISDADAESLKTPRILVDYVAARLPRADGSVCAEQRAFYRLRRAVTRAYGIQPKRIRPDTSWDTLLPPRYPSRAWRQIQKAVGAVDWPRYRTIGLKTSEATSVGTTARYLATVAPASLKHDGEGWSRLEIEKAVRGLIAEELAITDFEWDDSFARDLGLD